MSESNCFLVTSSTSCLLLKLTEAQNPTKINNLYQNIFTTNYRLVQNSKKNFYHRLFFIILQEELACYTNRSQKYTRLLRRLFPELSAAALSALANFWAKCQIFGLSASRSLSNITVLPTFQSYAFTFTEKSRPKAIFSISWNHVSLQF